MRIAGVIASQNTQVLAWIVRTGVIADIAYRVDV
jgi:hypothetical protein